MGVAVYPLTRLIPGILLSVACVFGATINPIAISLDGGPYVSTDYVNVNAIPGNNGTFTYDNEVQWFSFTIGGVDPTAIYLQTFSWARLGGFTPELTLFNADGTAVGGGTSTPGSYPSCGATDVVGGNLCLDAFIDAVVDPGSYLLALTQYGNDPQGNISDLFTYTRGLDENSDPISGCSSQSTYTTSCLGYGGSDISGTPFYDYNGTPLNGVWALSTGVPEPAPGLLIFSGLAVLAGIRKMRAYTALRQQTRSVAVNNNNGTWGME